MSQQVRIKGEDKDLINEVRYDSEVVELARELGVIEEDAEKVTWPQYFELMIPPNADPISRPEEEMCWQQAGEAKEELNRLAGDNVAIHEVVTVFTERFIEKFSIEVGDD